MLQSRQTRIFYYSTSRPKAFSQIVADIGRILQRINRELGTTILFVEQDLDMIVTVSQLCYVMDKGRIVAEHHREALQIANALRGFTDLKRAVDKEKDADWLKDSILACRAVAQGQGRNPPPIVARASGHLSLCIWPLCQTCAYHQTRRYCRGRNARRLWRKHQKRDCCSQREIQPAGMVPSPLRTPKKVTRWRS